MKRDLTAFPVVACMILPVCLALMPTFFIRICQKMSAARVRAILPLVMPCRRPAKKKSPVRKIRWQVKERSDF